MRELATGEPIPSVWTPGRNPFANPFEVSQGDPASGAFGGLDEPLRDAVIRVTPETRFLLRDSFQLFPGALGVPSLQPLPSEVVLATDRFDSLTRVGFALGVGICRDISDPKIDAQEILDLDRGTLGDLDRGAQMELSTSVDQIDLAFEPVEPLALILAETDCDPLATFQSRKTDGVEPLEAQDTLVVTGYPVTRNLRKVLPSQEVRRIHQHQDMPRCGSPIPPT